MVVWDKLQTCIWPSRCHCHSLSLPPVNPDWFYPSWFYLSGTFSPGCCRTYPGCVCLADIRISQIYVDNRQESLANAKVNARQHCVSLSCLCNSLTQIEWVHVVQLLLPPKHAKSREIPREFDLTAVQGHPRSSILVSIESPDVTSY